MTFVHEYSWPYFCRPVLWCYLLQILIWVHMSNHVLFMWRRPVKVQINLSFCITEDHALENVFETATMGPHILHFSTRLRWVVSFTFCPLLPHVEGPVTYCVRSWVVTVVERLAPSTPWRHIGGSKDTPPPILNLSTRWEWAAVHPGRCTCRKNVRSRIMLTLLWAAH